jgi:hypothetical protein
LWFSSVLVGKPEKMRQLEKLRCRREENIRMGLTEIWWEGVEWLNLT